MTYICLSSNILFQVRTEIKYCCLMTVKHETQSCNKLVYSFFLQSVIYIALFFYIEHYLVRIHQLRKL